MTVLIPDMYPLKFLSFHDILYRPIPLFLKRPLPANRQSYHADFSQPLCHPSGFKVRPIYCADGFIRNNDQSAGSRRLDF